MLFNSIDYLIFLPVVVAVYYALPTSLRWLLLLVASYFFYMCWKPEYALLLLFTTSVDYMAALKMGSAPSKRVRKTWLIMSLVANLGMLVGFKYLNFFTGSVNLLFSELDVQFALPVYKILLPVGISFYTFQSLSYSIDVFRGIKNPETHFGKFAVYVSFFPQLVAGPIERSGNLLPQIHHPKPFDQERLISGLKLMAWGYFKKLVIADRLGMFVSYIYDTPAEHKGLPVILATLLFAFQIYCDFSGYTDIARGSARILGYDLMINFRRPLIATSLKEFWNRWHISLTTWFRDYVLYSLPYIRNKKVVYGKLYFNLILTYLLMGFWHGANWTFMIFGFIHGVMLVFETTTEKLRYRMYERLNIDRYWHIQRAIGFCATFSVVVFSLFFFRANTLGDSLTLIANMFDFSDFGGSIREILKNYEVIFGIFMIIVLLTTEYIHEKYDLIRLIAKRPVYIKWMVYTGFLFFILLFGILQKQKFLYFQF